MHLMLGMSLMYIENRRGERQEPCGTPTYSILGVEV